MLSEDDQDGLEQLRVVVPSVIIFFVHLLNYSVTSIQQQQNTSNGCSR